MKINGCRPAHLMVHKSSHQIQKHSTTTTTRSSATSGHHHQQQQPVIIYIHSPKVIHTEARHFMALVQKLTGLRHDTKDHEKTVANPTDKPTSATTKAHEPASVVETSLANELGFNMPGGFFSPGMLLFTPRSADNFFCSPRSMYRFSSPKANPAVLEF